MNLSIHPERWSYSVLSVFLILVDIESLLIWMVPLYAAHYGGASPEPRVSFKHFV